MNETVTYEWTEELGMAAEDSFQKAKYTSLKVVLFFGVFLIIGGTINFFQSESKIVPIYLFVLGIINVSIYFIRKRLSTKILKDIKRLQGDPMIYLTLTDENLIIKSANTLRTINWDHVTKIEKIKGFFCLYSGMIFLLTLPIAPLSTTQVDFILAKSKKIAKHKR